MSWNLHAIKSIFNRPDVREELERGNLSYLFNDLESNRNLCEDVQKYHVASFIMYEINYPLLEKLDTITYYMFDEDPNLKGTLIIPSNIEYIEQIVSCNELKEIVFEGKYLLNTLNGLSDDCLFGLDGLNQIIFTHPQSFTKEEFIDFCFHENMENRKRKINIVGLK